MEKKKLYKTAYMAVIWLVILLVILAGATYAWFTFNPATNVTPISSTISNGDTQLLISNNPNGGFAEECTLVLDGTVNSLAPLSTADLSGFYRAKAQNRDGISILFAEANEQVNSSVMHGKVYLKCENDGCDVYFYRSGLELGGDAQTLAALRLGMKISTISGKHTYIFRLDSLGNTAAAAAKQTIAEAGKVVSSVDGSGAASFVADPSENIGSYMAVEQGANDRKPGKGEKALCTLQTDEVASVEYWLYLEGCDDNCIGEVQSKDVGLQLAFAGVAEE